MFVVYVLKSCKFDKSYVGQTRDIVERFAQHNSEHKGYTNKYKPWYIIYLERYLDREKAVKREKYLKSFSGRKFLKTIFSKYK